MALEYDADESYQAAIAHLADPRFQAPLEEFRNDHQRQLSELEPLIRRLGGTPPTRPDLHGRLEEARLLFAQLGGDEAILKEVCKDARHAAEAYQQALGEAPDEALEILERGRDHELRHVDWISEAVKKLEAAPHRGVPPWNIPPPSGL